jgi:hypothetical protein
MAYLWQVVGVGSGNELPRIPYSLLKKSVSDWSVTQEKVKTLKH